MADVKDDHQDQQHKHGDPDDGYPITRDQADATGRMLAPAVRYLARLRTGMERRGFLPADPVYQACSEAYDKLRELAGWLQTATWANRRQHIDPATKARERTRT